MAALTKAELELDVQFLLERCNSAGSAYFGGDRWTGASSNALVRVAYGVDRHYAGHPYDEGDYTACVRTFRRLPRHRRTPQVREALKLARSIMESHRRSREQPA